MKSEEGKERRKEKEREGDTSRGVTVIYLTVVFKRHSNTSSDSASFSSVSTYHTSLVRVRAWALVSRGVKDRSVRLDTGLR